MSAVLKNSIVLIMQPHFIRSIAVSSLCLSIVACSNDFSAGSSLKNLLMSRLFQCFFAQQGVTKNCSIPC